MTDTDTDTDTRDSRESRYRVQNPQYTMLPSIDVLNKYGIPKSTALYMQQSFWRIEPEYQNIFSSYYLLYWSAEYFSDRLHRGVITRDGVDYQVRFYNCDSGILYGAGSKQVALSFRELQPEYKAAAIVLVTAK